MRDLFEVRPTMTDRDAPVVRAVSAAIEAVLGRAPITSCLARHLRPEAYRPDRRLKNCIAYGPGVLDLAHQPDEWIGIDDMVDSAKVMALRRIRGLRLRELACSRMNAATPSVEIARISSGSIRSMQRPHMSVPRTAATTLWSSLRPRTVAATIRGVTMARFALCRKGWAASTRRCAHSLCAARFCVTRCRLPLAKRKRSFPSSQHLFQAIFSTGHANMNPRPQTGRQGRWAIAFSHTARGWS
jgi:hypothetical protein